jgi:hypothetical protein
MGDMGLFTGDVMQGCVALIIALYSTASIPAARLSFNERGEKPQKGTHEV